MVLVEDIGECQCLQLSDTLSYLIDPVCHIGRKLNLLHHQAHGLLFLLELALAIRESR